MVEGKPMTQQQLNNEIQEKYNKTWNSGREETLPNTTLENLLMMCDYFKLKPAEFFELVEKVTEKEFTDTVNNKEKLSTAYKNIS